jgi:hypothetical protein
LPCVTLKQNLDIGIYDFRGYLIDKDKEIFKNLMSEILSNKNKKITVEFKKALEDYLISQELFKNL